MLANLGDSKNILFFFKSSKISEKSSESLYNLGEKEIITSYFNSVKSILIECTENITSNMEKRGGGIMDIQLNAAKSLSAKL